MARATRGGTPGEMETASYLRSAVLPRPIGLEAALPAGAVLAVAIGAWLLAGVTVREIALFLAYHAAFVLVPGILVYVALIRQRSGVLRTLALGWGLGYVLESLAFVLSGLTAQWVFLAYPAVTIAAATLVVRRRAIASPTRVAAPSAADRRFAWGLAAVCSVALIAVAAASFPTTPLPRDVGAVDYHTDTVWFLALAGEAKHHWPITNAIVAGEPLNYHTFAFMDLAAASRVAGIELPVVLMRLAPLPLVVLSVLMLGLAGSSITGRRWAGPLAAALFFFAGELDLDINLAPLFNNSLFESLYHSQTFLLGVPLFAGSMLLLWERVSSRSSEAGAWIVTALFLIGCGGAKGVTLPLLAGGLLGYAGWQVLATRRIDRRALAALAVVTSVMAFFYFVVYGAYDQGVELSPFDIVTLTPAVAPLVGGISSPFAEALLWPVAVAVAFLGMFAALLVGALFAPKEGWRRPASRHVFLLSLLLAGLGPLYVFGRTGSAQAYFAWYGVIAGSILAAEGLGKLWSRVARDRRATRALLVFLAIWTGGIVAVVIGRAGLLDDPDPLATSSGELALWLLLIASGPVLAVALARVRPASAAGWSLPAAVSALVLAGTLDQPLDTGPTLVRQARDEQTFSPTGPLLTDDLYEGFRWIRDNTDDDAVLAVKRREVDLPERYYYLSGFAERRVVLEGWLYTERSSRVGHAQVIAGTDPYPQRRELNRRAFTGDPAAVTELQERWSVDYLVVDKVHSRPSDLGRLGTRVFSNDALDVYKVRQQV